MAKMKKKFNAKKAQRGQNGFEPIPPGKYPAQIVESEIKKSSAGNDYLKIVYQVLDGEFKGRKIFDNFNLWNDNSTAREIAEREFANLCDALGLGTQVIEDSKILHKTPFLLKVKVRPAEGQYDATNDAAGYFPLEEKKGKKGKKKKGKKKNNPWED